MRYLGPVAFAAASLVLLLATDPTGLDTELPAAEPAAAPSVALAAALVKTPAPAPRANKARPRRTVLRDQVAVRGGARARTTFSGPAFDACDAPSLDTLRAWRTASPYGAIGIYVSGSQRACDQAQLNSGWVREARRMGWMLIPTTVGLQAPCGDLPSKPQHIDPAHAVQQGRDEAAHAVTAMRALGLGRGNPVYLDMEAYPTGDPVCSKGVIDFVLGWTQTLHSAGYVSGFYSSVNSGIADLADAARAGDSPLPDTVWYARWDGNPTTVDGSAPLGGDLWMNHQRIHQHRGSVTETYGGATLVVDRDQVDGPVAG